MFLFWQEMALIERGFVLMSAKAPIYVVLVAFESCCRQIEICHSRQAVQDMDFLDLFFSLSDIEDLFLENSTHANISLLRCVCWACQPQPAGQRNN